MPVRSLYFAGALVLTMLAAVPSIAETLSRDQARETAVDAYVYAYPLVLMETSRGVMTNVAEPSQSHAPVNQWLNRRTFPDASFTDVVRPNADTLYSSLWFDVSREPVILTVPDSEGRYYLLQMLDMWTDVFAVPGKRTTGTGPQLIALTGPNWQGALPPQATVIRSPTATGWVLGRTQTNGKADYDAVHQFQDGLRAAPLSEWAGHSPPSRGTVNPNQDMSAPVQQVAQMSPAQFYDTFIQSTELNPPHANDYPILHRMGRLGMSPGTPFASLPPATQQVLAEAIPVAQKRIVGQGLSGATHVNGWEVMTSNVGSYGPDYLRRAGIAYFGLGANRPEDAVYPSTFTDSDGQPLSSDGRYVVHFARGQIPPVNAFWSLTMYNAGQFFAQNPINRYNLGDRDPLQLNADGSLDLIIQRDPPSPGARSNWLPAPQSGPFSLTMRLYWPKQQVLTGAWTPPPVQRVDRLAAAAQVKGQ